MKLQPDTKDAVLFIGGVFGTMIQVAMYYLSGVEPSWPLVAIFAGMMGVPIVTEFDRKRRNGGTA